MDLLLQGGMILTGNKTSGYQVMENGCLGITGGTITYLSQVPPWEEVKERKLCSGWLLIPGLINCHTHTPMGLMRGLGSALPLQEWLFDHMMPVEAKMTDEDTAAGTGLALLEMIACGTTSFSDMYHLPLDTIEQVLTSGMKANLCYTVQSFDPEETYENNKMAKDSIAFFKQWHKAGNGQVLVDFCLHAEYTCNPQVAAGYSAACKEAGAHMHLHLSETKREQEECIARWGKTPARWFADLGTFDSPTAAAHCVWVTPEDRQILLEKGVSVVHNPTSNLKLGSGFAPIPEMLSQGINVTLGTDGAASNNNLNMLEEMHLAALMHNGARQDPTLICPADVLAMATENGAKLQGRPDTGTLEIGKKADIAAIDLSAPHLYPCHDPLSLLVYAAQGSDVIMTMVNGKILYEKGEYLTLDREKIFYEAKRSVERLF